MNPVRSLPRPRSLVPETARLLGLHLLCLSVPLLSLSFLLSGPHVWYVALLWLVPLPVLEYLDRSSLSELRQPDPALPAWPFNALLLLMAGLQLLNIFLMVRLLGIISFWSIDSLMTWFLVGASSGFSGIVVAHELIHRPDRRLRQLGRAVLCTVMYEHFYTEHVRGHHVRVGTPEDPATARFGETFWHFYRRTVPGQFRSAWRLETQRLGDVGMKPWDRRILSSRVVQGLVAGWALAFAILGFFGVGAFALFLLQAWRASVLLEVVNYFEHWGLVRTGNKVRTIDSWDTDSWFTLYSLVGLSRHSDHHAFASRPYQQLRQHEQSPKLPGGYLTMPLFVLLRNAKFQELMTEELGRRRLGPFAAEAERVAEA